MKKILFYFSGIVSVDKRLFVSTAHLYLKTFIDINSPDLASQLIWTDSIQWEIDDDELVAICENEKIDILCTSHYIWNHDKLVSQLARIKDKINKKIIIVAGGPSAAVNTDADFFKKYPFFDYAIYGPGEQAFSDLMSSIIYGKKLVREFTSNLAWPDQDRNVVLAPYRYVKMISKSPFVHNSEIVKRMAFNIKEAGYQINFPYEVTRGCPYSCTFCDWNSGLGNKVSRREESFEEEIDLFFDIGVKLIYLSDANTGQYEEDIALLEYFAKRNLEEKSPLRIMGNFSKLKQKNNLKIFHIMAKGKLVNQGFNIACQDIDPEILKNIDRPDISWQGHCEVIDDLQKAYPNIPCQIQLIQGLPGQTVTTWRQTLSTVSKKNTILYIFINELLASTPAMMDLTYQEKFKFTYSRSKRFMGDLLAKEQNDFFRGLFAESCVSFTREDFVKMTIVSHFYTMLCGMKSRTQDTYPDWPIEYMVDDFLQSEHYQRLNNNLTNNWSNDNFFYTINFDDTPDIISACVNHHPAYRWMKTKLLVKYLSELNIDSKLKQLIINYPWNQVYFFDDHAYT